MAKIITPIEAIEVSKARENNNIWVLFLLN